MVWRVRCCTTSTCEGSEVTSCRPSPGWSTTSCPTNWPSPRRSYSTFSGQVSTFASYYHLLPFPLTSATHFHLLLLLNITSLDCGFANKLFAGSNTHNNGGNGGDGQTGDAGEGTGGELTRLYSLLITVFIILLIASFPILSFGRGAHARRNSVNTKCYTLTQSVTMYNHRY